MGSCNDFLEEAIVFAANKHRGQTRKKSGLPYITHPLEVMKLLSQWGIRDQQLWIAAVLHDILEDTDTSYEQLHDFFGVSTANLIQELTFTGAKAEKDQYLASFRDKSISALLIKIADRICNVRDFFPDSYARQYFYKALPLFIKYLPMNYSKIITHFSSLVYYNVIREVNALVMVVDPSGPALAYDPQE